MYVSTDQVRTDVARINQLQPELLGPDMQAKDRRRDDIQPIPACASIWNNMMGKRRAGSTFCLMGD